MSHGSQTLDAPGTTCPDWCVSRICDQDGVHIQEDTYVTDLDGRPQTVSAFVVEGGRRSGIYLGDYEFAADQIPALEAAIARAKQALSDRR